MYKFKEGDIVEYIGRPSTGRDIYLFEAVLKQGQLLAIFQVDKEAVTELIYRVVVLERRSGESRKYWLTEDCMEFSNLL